TTGNQGRPAVAMDAVGDFVIAWNSYGGQDGSNFGVYAQRYSTSGAPLAGEFRVNTYTTGYQGLAAVAVDGDGDFVVTWTSSGQDGDSYGVYAQRYARTVAVEAVRPVGASAPVAPGGVLVAPVSQLIVTFSGPLATAGAGSVTNPANWQLARYGTAVAGAITGITFGLNAATGKSEATLSLSAPLADGRYTL